MDALGNVEGLFQRHQGGPERSFHSFPMFLDKRQRRVSVSHPAAVFNDPSLPLFRKRAAAFGTGQPGEVFFERFLLHGCLLFFLGMMSRGGKG